jgi:hypothetical protein
VKLTGCSLSDNSLFSNVQLLSLKQCWAVKDLSSFRNIPHLHLENFAFVKDFSCLGNQRYLKIIECPRLTDEAVRNFGNVFHLSIVNCDAVSEITGLTNNRYVICKWNRCLTKIHLPGKDYLFVSVRKCYQMVELQITGRVYSLEVFPEISVKGLDSDYLNGDQLQYQLCSFP